MDVIYQYIPLFLEVDWARMISGQENLVLEAGNNQRCTLVLYACWHN